MYTLVSACILAVVAGATAAGSMTAQTNRNYMSAPLSSERALSSHYDPLKRTFSMRLSRAEHFMNLTEAKSHPALSSLVQRRLQITAPVYGDYAALAYFYSIVAVGTPPQLFSVIADSGSSLTAFACKSCAPDQCGTHQHRPYDPDASTTSHLLSCNECTSGTCDSGQCRYVVSYAEGSSISGIYYRDTTYLSPEPLANPDTFAQYTLHQFNFGCQLHEGGLFKTQYADGIMGVGHSGPSIITSLWNEEKIQRKMFSLCLSLDGGIMTAGHVDTSIHSGPVQWAALSLGAHYDVHIKSAVVGNRQMDVSLENTNTIVDSGTTFTYMPSRAYAEIKSLVTAFCQEEGHCKGLPIQRPGESICYTLADAADISTFPSIVLTLAGVSGDVTIVMAPQHVFLSMSWNGGAHCLGVFDNHGGGVVLGANSMMGYDVIFDLGPSRDDAGSDNPSQQPRAGFAPSACQYGQPAASPSAGVLPSASPKPSESSQGTQAPTLTPTRSPDSTSAATSTLTPTRSLDGSSTVTSTLTPTRSPDGSSTATSTPFSTSSPDSTSTATGTLVPTPSPDSFSTATSTLSATSSSSPSPTITLSVSSNSPLSSPSHATPPPTPSASDAGMTGSEIDAAVRGGVVGAVIVIALCICCACCVAWIHSSPFTVSLCGVIIRISRSRTAYQQVDELQHHQQQPSEQVELVASTRSTAAAPRTTTAATGTAGGGVAPTARSTTGNGNGNGRARQTGGRTGEVGASNTATGATATTHVISDAAHSDDEGVPLKDAEAMVDAVLATPTPKPDASSDTSSTATARQTNQTKGSEAAAKARDDIAVDVKPSP